MVAKPSGTLLIVNRLPGIGLHRGDHAWPLRALAEQDIGVERNFVAVVFQSARATRLGDNTGALTRVAVRASTDHGRLMSVKRYKWPGVRLDPTAGLGLVAHAKI